jgi:hypothetical protein
MRRITLLMALVLAIGIVPLAGATSSLSIGTPAYDSTVVKGGSFSVTSSITASGVGGSISVTATLQDNTGGAVTITNAEQVKTYESNTSKTFTWTVTANDPGTYSGPFTVSASASDGGSGSPAAGTTALTIKDRPVLELALSKNETTVNAGDSVRLNYTVTNSGGDDAADATDVNVSLILPDGWSLSDGTASYDLGTIAPGANKAGYWIVTADSPNATNTLTVPVTSTALGGTVTGSYTISEDTTVPPTPVSLANTSGSTWVNYTWTAGSGGGATDSYNVSMNVTTWHNGTTDTFLNTSVGSGGWANITVWAYNTSGSGNLSESCASDEVQARIPGDVTGNGVVNIGDATLLFNWVSFVNERETTYALTEAGNADVTGDGNVNIGDATLLFNWVSFENERGTTYVLK